MVYINNNLVNNDLGFFTLQETYKLIITIYIFFY